MLNMLAKPMLRRLSAAAAEVSLRRLHAAAAVAAADPASAKTHADSNVPGNPAYHFSLVKPGTPAKAGWAQRPLIIGGAGVGTKCVHGGAQPDPAYGAVVPPVYNTSTFAFSDIKTNAGFDYTRSGNPTRACLEEALALLEGGEGATCTSTGMSAVLVALNLLPHGAHVLATADCYGGTWRTLEHARRVYGLRVTYADLSDARVAAAAIASTAASEGGLHMVWVETPSNPLLRVTDVAAVAAQARAAGALTVVDNTFLSPILARPLEAGADVVIHSATKYLNGHSDVVGGAVVTRKGDPALAQRAASLNNLLGTSQSPHDCALVMRGLKTLKLRVLAHQAGARAVAAFLRGHRAVARVNYPGVGGMLSFELAAAATTSSPGAVDAVLRGLRWFTLAESLGGVESLVAHPATMTHASMTPAARAAAGISDGLVRLSVGIEEPEDLIADLARVLDPLAAAAAGQR